VTFGNLAPASLAGSVYVDANDDGSRQGTEAGVGNVTVTLTGTDDQGRAVNDVTATGSDGTYTFAGLRPSNAAGYTITESPPAGFFAGRQTIGTPGGNAAVAGRFSGIVLAPGAAGAANNFGALVPASLAGFVYVDANNDGLKQGTEAGLGNVSLTLTGTDDLGAAVRQVTTTAGTGAYSFSGLRPGTYAVAVGQPAGYVAGLDTAGTPGASPATPGVLGGIALASGVAGAGNNFGELPTADLAVTQTIDDATPNVGQVVTFTVTLANAGPSTATNVAVAVADALPAGLTLVSATPSQGTYAGGTWSVGTVAPGAAPTLTIVARVVSPDRLTNLAAISAGDQADPTTPDNAAGATETPPQADLGVTLAVSDPTPNVGEVLTYTVSLANFGPDAATGAAVTDLLPAGLALISATPSRGTYDAATGVWSVGPVAVAGPAATLTMTARVVGPQARADRAAITAADQYDPVAANNAAIVAETPRQADLSLTQAVDNPTPPPGGVIVLTLTLANAGPDAATGVTVADLLPAGLTFVSAAPGQGTYDPAAGVWTVGTVPAGARPTLQILAEVSGPGVLVNPARVATVDQYDPTTPDNAASVGVATTSTLAGTVYGDANGDGRLTPGEPGVAGVVLTLTGTDVQGRPVNQSTTTAAAGTYAFPGLTAGTYTIAETPPPAAYADGLAAAGSAGGIPGRDVIAAIPLNAGVIAAGYNFGELGAGISGRVAADNAAGLGGVTITLEAADGTVLTTTTTAGDGSYRFADLPAAPYRVVETPPVGYGLGSPATIAATLTPAGLAGQDFAATTASLAGSVYVDARNDGLKEPGEAGVPGVTVTLTGLDATGATIGRATATAPDGSYRFPGLLAGTYAITEAAPAGYLAGKESVGTPGGTAGPGQFTGIPLAAGLAGAGHNFGELLPAGLAGIVYADANDDGIKQAGELGLAGAALTLTGTDDLGHPVTASATTAADGSYNFTGLRPGTYAIAAAVPAGDLAGKAAAGTLGGTPGVATVAAIAATSGAAGTGYDFGELAPATVAGRVFLDANDDGVKQPGESGVPGVAVTLTGTDDLGRPVDLTTATGPDGTYRFAGLRPGTYAVARAIPAGDLAGKVGIGCNCGGSAADGTVSDIVLNPGCAVANPDFPLVRASALAGSVYIDANNDGVRQAGEAGLPGVPLTLTGVDDLGHAVALTTPTGADGTYAFANLRPGTYAIAEATPAGMFAGKVAAGSLGGVAGPGQVAGIVAGPGSPGTGYDFAALAPASLAGFVYADANDDGIKQAGEAGLAGVAVTLTGIDDLGRPIRLTATTAADGSYNFTGLRPGGYTLTEAAPAGFLAGRDAAGPAGGQAGGRAIAGIGLAAGAAAAGNDFGEVAPARLAGTAFLDRNGDGRQDPGEPGLAGVPITLTGRDDRGAAVAERALTGAHGSFAFAGLRPGDYALATAGAAGYAEGRATAGSAAGAGGTGTVAGIRLAAGTAATGYAFPERGATIAGNAFADATGDGAYHPGDARLGGITVLLRDARGRTVATTTTARDGSYRFIGIPAGEYTVFIAKGAGAGLSRRVIAAPGGRDQASLAVPVADALVMGSAFLDRNDDGVRSAGEPGVGGVPITLSGVDDGGHMVARSTATAADGTYRFPGLPAGRYAVAEGPAAGLLGGKARPAGVLRLAAGATLAGPSFAELAPAGLSGSVYLDGNRDGTLDPNDFGIAHVVVTLAGVDDLGHAVAESTATATDGTYRFAGLRPGTYSLSESEPGVFLASGSPVGGRFPVIPLQSGTAAAGYNFGELARAACRLQTPQLQALVRQGPHPLGAPAGFALTPSAATVRALPVISYWLPTLAARFGLKSSR